MRLTALDEAAETLNLRKHMGVAEARAIYPTLDVIEDDPAANRRFLEAIADWCDRYTPLVALDGVDGFFVQPHPQRACNTNLADIAGGVDDEREHNASLIFHAARFVGVLGGGGEAQESGKVDMIDVSSGIAGSFGHSYEDPAFIRSEVMAGAPAATEIGGRREAIAAAIAGAGADDIVLLAGKGHEQGKIVGDRILPFDDVQVARECAG